MRYKSKAARMAQAMQYGHKTYWDYLDEHAQELHDKFMAQGDKKRARMMFTRDLGEALRGAEEYRIGS